MSKKLRISDAMRITGLKRHRITEMRERKVINPERESWGYGYTDELIGQLSIYSGLKDDIKMPYSTIKTLNKFLEESPSFTERIQEIYRVFQNYDCTENYIDSKKYFYIYCNSVLELDDEFEELLEEITSEKIVYPENETLKSMYNYYLYKANVIDVYRDLYNIENEFESEFWSLDVVKAFNEYIFNNSPLITAKIDEHLICTLMNIQYNSESKNSTLIKELTNLLKKIKKLNNQTNTDYDTWQHIYLHAIMLLSFNIFNNQP